METIMSFMAADHDRLNSIFKGFQELKQQSLQEARELFLQFKSGLDRHILWEEEILFPLFEQKTGITETGPTTVMRMEHKQIKACLESIRGKLETGAAPEAVEQELLGVLTAHNEKEEGILYPWLDEVMTESEREETFRKIKLVPEQDPVKK